MSCAEFELLIVSDDPADRERAARHALECELCAATLAAHDRLSERAFEWREAVRAPRGLERRVRRALAEEPVPLIQRQEAETAAAGSWRRWRMPAALAASLLVGLALGWLPFRSEPAPELAGRLLVVEALEEAKAAEREHARAIARLEQAAAPLLGRARDPETRSADARRLLAYADRLAFLDSTIAEVAAFVDENPGHSHSRVTLLAAYKEKTEILREVLALGETS